MGEKQYSCIHCAKAFYQSHDLVIHIRTHTEEKPFACSSCDKSFSRSEGLKIPRRKHTGEKPYVCLLVTLQVTRHRESLVTLGAGIRFLSVVYYHVSL